MNILDAVFLTMKILLIEAPDSGQRLDKYLKRCLPSAGTGFLYKMLRKKNILLNGRKAAGNETLKPGDEVRLYFSDETFEKFSAAENEAAYDAAASPYWPLSVLYEDEELAFIDKPPGLLSQRAKKTDLSLNELFRQYCKTDGSYRPSVVNRLDRNTSGIVIAAKTLHGAQFAAGLLKDRACEKYYHCIVRGVLDAPVEERSFLEKNETTNQVRIFSEAAAGREEIRTGFSPLKHFSGYTYLRVRLYTGKSHQIRAQLSAMGLPILGDPKYGDPAENRRWEKRTGLKRQLLHAAELKLPGYPLVTAPDPEDFANVLEVL